MALALISILAYPMFTLIIHRGKYSPPLSATQRPVREYIEVGVVVACLLVLPYIRFNLLWFSGWGSAYFVFGLVAFPIMELVVRKRSLSVIGFRMPTNKRVVVLVAAIIFLFLVAGLLKPFVLGVKYDFGLQRIVSNCIIFPFIEEALFRGVIQTRLESALGAVRAWVISGLFFSFYHYYHYFLVPGIALTTTNILQLISVAAFGMLFGVIFAKTRSLLPSFLLHCVNNLFAVTPW